MKPINEMSIPEISREIFVKNNSKLATQVMKTSPDIYRAARKHAETEGDIAPRYRDAANAPLAARVKANAPAEFDLAVTQARMEFSEAECRRYLVESNRNGNKDNYAALVASDPAKAARLRKAAQSYGIVPARIERPVQTPKVESDGRFQISPELSQKANIPLSTRLNLEEFSQLVTLLNPPVEPDGNV
jgi:hypothetical protein